VEYTVHQLRLLGFEYSVAACKNYTVK
jgi:hypothetical protein